jgi:hypothetical protein
MSSSSLTQLALTLIRATSRGGFRGPGISRLHVCLVRAILLIVLEEARKWWVGGSRVAVRATLSSIKATFG